jgi:hypothetical protein
MEPMSDCTVVNPYQPDPNIAGAGVRFPSDFDRICTELDPGNQRFYIDWDIDLCRLVCRSLPPETRSVPSSVHD